MTLNGVMAITLRYLSEFGKPVLQKTICGGIYARVYCIVFLVRVQCRRKESSRSLSHLLMSFLYSAAGVGLGLVIFALCRQVRCIECLTYYVIYNWLQMSFYFC